MVECPDAAGWTLIGDCLRVRLHGTFWARARVVATVESETLGSLLLLHAEGYGEVLSV